MSALGDVLAALASVFDGLGFGWFVFGAQAVAVRGAPRATQDVDVTVEVPRDQLPSLLKALKEQGLLAQLEEALGQSDLLPALQAAIDDVRGGSN